MAKKEKTVRQVYSLSDIALLAGILAVGLALSFLVPSMAGLGYTILLCWVLMIPFWHHGYRIAGQKGVFSMKEILPHGNARMIFWLSWTESLTVWSTIPGWTAERL